MGVHISRIQIDNFRNFKEFDVKLSEKAVIVGENGSGKTNLIHAIRLVLDPRLADSARQLREEDFWDGLESPMESGAVITICIDLQGFDDNDSLLAILSDYHVENGETPTARITYKYAPALLLGEDNGRGQDTHYDFLVYGGEDETNIFGYQQRKWLPLEVLPALRDAEADLSSWRKSPLRPLLERLQITRQDLESAAAGIDDATREILNLNEMGAALLRRP